MTKIVVLDVETGGLNSKKNGLCSVSLKVFGSETWCNFLIKPNLELNYGEKAFSINGLNLSDLERRGLPEPVAVTEIEAFIIQNWPTHRPCVLGQNVGFDLAFMNALFLRNRTYSFSSLIGYVKFDTLSNTLIMQEAGIVNLHNTSLGAAYRFFCGKDPVDAHQAVGDVRMTEELFRAQCSLLRGLPEKSVDSETEALLAHLETIQE